MLFILTLYLATNIEIVPSPLPLFAQQDNDVPIRSSVRYDSLNLNFIGNWPFGASFVTASDTVHNICYLGSGAGVYLIDVSDPAQPLERNHLHTRGGELYGLIYDCSLLYMTDRAYGFQIWDVQNPDDPVYLGGCEIYGTYLWGSGAWGLAVSYPYAYVVSEDSGLVILDVSDPCNPYEVGRCYLQGQSCNVALSGDYAYVTHAHDIELAVINVSDPENPVYVDGCLLPFVPVDVVISGSSAYVCGVPGQYAFAIIDISSPSVPVLLSSCYLSTDLHGCRGLSVKDTVAYVASTETGLYILNVSDPYNPFVVGNSIPYYMTHDVVVADTLAYIADLDGGLRIMNVSEPQSPFEIGAFDCPYLAYSTIIEYPHAYILDHLSGLYVLDVSEIQHPEEVRHIENAGEAMSYEGILEHPYLYIADGVGGLNIKDISDPLNPIQVGICSTGYAVGVAKKDTCVYVVDEFYPGIRIVNVATPENPHIIHSESFSSINSISVYGDRAYAGSSDFSPLMKVYDISYPALPVLIGDYAISSRDIALRDTLAFVAGIDGFSVLDVSDPSDIQLISHYSGNYHSVAVQESYAFAAGHDSIGWNYGFTVDMFDISDVYNPTRVGYYSTPNRANDVAIHDSLILVSCGSCGLQIYTPDLLTVHEHIDDNITPVSLTLFPNPARGHFTIRFSARQRERITVTLFDAVGRATDEIYKGYAEIGLNSIPYTNVTLPNGVYFVRLKMSHSVQTHKIIIQR